MSACVCGHAPAHHDKRKSIPQGLMSDYKVIFGCGWTGCGCPRFVEAKPPADLSEQLHALCDRHEWGALRWEHPLPVPGWIAEVRALLPPRVGSQDPRLVEKRSHAPSMATTAHEG